MTTEKPIPASPPSTPGVWIQLRQTVRALSEVGLALAPWAPAPKPHRASDISESWLTEVFAAQAQGAAVEKVEMLDGHLGTTDRCPIAVTWSGTSAEAPLPGRLFVKATPRSAKNRTMVAALAMAVNEVAFFRTARHDLPDVMAPVAYAAHAGRGARHLILMEDIVEQGGRAFRLADDCDVAHAEGVVQALGVLHATFWDSQRFTGDLSFAVRQFSRPGFGLLRRQFRKVRTTIADGDHDIPDAARRMIEVVNANERTLYARWEQGPMTLIHGDSHLGNTFQREDGRAGLLDWQVVQQAPGIREVSYFLTHSVPTQLRRDHEERLVGLYLATLRERGVADVPSFDAAWADYRFFAFDAWDSSAITVAWPGLQDPDSVEASFRRANATIEDLEVDRALVDALT